MSTLNKWITTHGDTDVVLNQDRERALGNDRRRRETRILREERDILKKATQFFASQKPCGSGSLKNSAGRSRSAGCAG